MTVEEFQKRWHDYRTDDREEALLNARQVNLLADGFTAVAIKCGDEYGLMTLTAAVGLVGVIPGLQMYVTPRFVREEVKRRLLAATTDAARQALYLFFLFTTGWGKADVMDAADDIGMNNYTGTLTGQLPPAEKEQLREEVKTAVRRALEE